MSQAQNTIREKTEPVDEPVKDISSKSKPRKWLNPEEYFSKDNIGNTLPFIFYLSFLSLLYISNNYYAEKTIRSINKITDELKELKSEYISVKSELMYGSKQSEVAKAVDSLQLKESVVPPVKIVNSE